MPNAYPALRKRKTIPIPFDSRSACPRGFGSRRKCEDMITEGRVEGRR